MNATYGIWTVSEESASVLAELDSMGYAKSLSSAQYRKLLRKPSYAVLVSGESDGIQLIARGLAVVERIENSIEIKRLVVRPDYRRTGECGRIIDSLSGEQLQLELAETSTVALRVAKRLGFEAVNIMHNRFGTVDGIQLIRRSNK